MKYKDLKDRDVKELQNLLKDQRVGLGKLRFELNNKSLLNPSKFRSTRRDIAKILTTIKTVNK